MTSVLGAAVLVLSDGLLTSRQRPFLPGPSTAEGSLAAGTHTIASPLSSKGNPLRVTAASCRLLPPARSRRFSHNYSAATGKVVESSVRCSVRERAEAAGGGSHPSKRIEVGGGKEGRGERVCARVMLPFHTLHVRRTRPDITLGDVIRRRQRPFGASVWPQLSVSCASVGNHGDLSQND